MKYLTKEYWDKINTNKINNKGICFENLVKKLLLAEYGKAVFQETKGSWDGSKDFFYYSQQKKYWAECKNYTSNIDLKVLASTLIMAQLSEIDTILYYSYSPININTKSKLLLNANKRGKTIYFYDDIVLEQKIFQYWSYIEKDYFPEFIQNDIQFEGEECNPEAKCLLYGNPLDLGTAVDGYEIKHLTLFKMLEMDICVINRKNESIRTSFGFKKVTQFKTQFDIFPEHMFKAHTEIDLGPYEGKSIRLWLIPVKENCKIPNPYINGKRLSLPANVEFKALESKKSRRLIGQSYEHCICNFKENVLLGTNQLRICVFYGNSGTGKSKLFQECLNISKINGYEVISYGILNNSKDALSVKDFIQRLLTAIYNISLDVLEDIIKELQFGESNASFIKEKPEYCMLAEAFDINNDMDMKNWAKRYLDLIIVKLAKFKFLIAIDNVQFFNDAILDLVDTIYTKLCITNQCNTKLLFTFNLDYIKKESKASLLLGKYTSNCATTYTEHIIGFKSAKECYEFLQETFSIGDIFQKTDIEYMTNNLSRNPFYLEQMIYWLQEKQVLEQNQNSYKIKDDILFRHLIQNIPNTVYDIISERWDYYQNNNKLELDKTTILFSAIHLYKELTKEDIDKLNISWNVIKELEKMGFIELEDSFNFISIRFFHDLIDKFFSKMYKSFSKKIIEYENEINITLRSNDTRYYFGKLYDKTGDPVISNELLSQILSLNIDAELSYEFYLLVFEKALANFEYNYLLNEAKSITIIYQIIVLIHDTLGNDVMQKCVDELLFKLRNKQDIFTYVEYGKMLLYISEAYDSMGKYSEAIKLIKDYKEKVFNSQDEKLLSVEQKKIISQIYNRLHVYCRHQVNAPLENEYIMSCLNKSSKIADEIQDAVMKYVNYSDRGYLYYDLPLYDKNHVKTMYYWKEACNIYENGNAKEKYINYLRKKTQLALLECDSEKAIQAAEKGLEEIDLSPYAYQKTFFKWWFYHALSEAYLLNYTDENAEDIEKSLERSYFYSELLASNKKFYYLQLKAIYMYYSGRSDYAIELNNEAKRLVELSNYKLKKDSIKEQLFENETVFNSGLKERRNALYSQIYTNDGLFNLPCI